MASTLTTSVCLSCATLSSSGALRGTQLQVQQSRRSSRQRIDSRRNRSAGLAVRALSLPVEDGENLGFAVASGGAIALADPQKRRDKDAESAGGNDIESVRDYFNTEDFERWRKIYGETDEVKQQQEVGRGAGSLGLIGNTRSLDLSSYEGLRGDGKTGRNGEGEACVDWKNDERVQRSCEAGKSLRIAVLVSGGVDSSVALRLLCDAGHSCTAFYLKIWFQDDFENFWSTCPWEEDLSYAQSVCDEVGVELRVVHLTDAYWAKVVSESLAEIRAGRTPNPDMLCNSKIKFGEFLEHIRDSSFERIASGHYGRVERIGEEPEQQIVQLFLSPDSVKDQTYFLSQLTQLQMSHLMFPLGGLTKAEVREMAEAMGLSNKQRKDSQGICFLGKVKFSEFIERHLGEKEGFMLEAETGEVLGLHNGFWFYTIGQRQGLRLSNGPWFVVAKDVEHNVIFISRKYFSDKKRRSFRVGSLNWISGHVPFDVTSMRCKVRHGPKMYNCSFDFDESEPTESEADSRRFRTAVVLLAEDDQGIAPGQYAAFYQGDVCLGSGVITEALGDDQQANVSAVALEAARTCDVEFWKNSKDAKSRSAGVLKGDAEHNRGRRTRNTSTGDVSDSTPVGSPGPLPTQDKASSNADGRNGVLPSLLLKFMSWLKVLK